MANYQPVRLAFSTSEPFGKADPPLAPILFLHGILAFKEHWGDIPQIVANATKRKAYALDARNHGDSEWSDDFSFDLNVEDVIYFMDENGIDKAILVGHSMGGVTAIKAALRWPDRIEKIIVEDMLVRKIAKQTTDSIRACVSISQKALEILPDNLDENGAKKFIRKYYLSNLPPEMAKLLKGNAREDRTDFVKLHKDTNGQFTFKTNLRVIERALLDHNKLSSEPSGVYEGPALFIYGELSPLLVYIMPMLPENPEGIDELSRKVAYRGDLLSKDQLVRIVRSVKKSAADAYHIKQFFPNVVFAGIEDATHDVHTEKPLEFTDALLKFIS